VKSSNVTDDLSMISPEQSTTDDFGVGEKLGPGVGSLVRGLVVGTGVVGVVGSGVITKSSGPFVAVTLGVSLTVLLGILLGDELGLELG